MSKSLELICSDCSRSISFVEILQLNQIIVYPCEKCKNESYNDGWEAGSIKLKAVPDLKKRWEKWHKGNKKK